MNTYVPEDFEFKLTENRIYLSNERYVERRDFEWWVYFCGRISDPEAIGEYWANETREIIQADLQTYIKRSKLVAEWSRTSDCIKHITDDFQ